MSHSDKVIKIGDLAKQLSISTRTIRYYEEVGLMKREAPGGIRAYNKSEVLRLRFILKLKELGIPLREMKKLAVNFELNDRSTDKILPPLLEVLEIQLRGIDDKVDNLLALRGDILDYQKRVLECLQQIGSNQTANG